MVRKIGRRRAPTGPKQWKSSDNPWYYAKYIEWQYRKEVCRMPNTFIRHSGGGNGILPKFRAHLVQVDLLKYCRLRKVGREYQKSKGKKFVEAEDERWNDIED